MTGIPGIVNTARSLAYLDRLQSLTANNLANTNSDGFKGDRLTAHLLPGLQFPVPVQKLDLQQGTFRDTARPLDVGLDGAGFLVVDTAQGERLIRGGSLQLDVAGRLTDLHGDPVLGEKGPIIVTGSSLEVEADGTITADGATLGRLRVVNVENPSSLKKEGLGRFIADGELLDAPMTTRVRQGAVEEANVDPLSSMVDLITIQRAYAANLDALKAMDSVLGSVTTEVGKV